MVLVGVLLARGDSGRSGHWGVVAVREQENFA
jgi:hypothetical protein